MLFERHELLLKKNNSDEADIWSESLLGELTDNFDSIRVPVKQADRRAGPYPYYGASGIVDSIDDYLFDGEYLLIAEDGENLRTRNTPIAFLANGKFWVNNHAHIVRGNHKANTRYLMYALSALDISGYLTGSTMPKLTQGNMNRIRVLAPPLPEQCAIAHILGTLDDKIELNRRMNETLEAIARELFKSWFVDFDPVRAKMEGRDTGLPKHIADLFPERMVESELGEIPEGWDVKTLGDIAEISSGKRPTIRYPIASSKASIPLWGGNGPMAFVPESLVDYPILLTGRVGTLGSVFRITSPCYPSDNTLVLRTKLQNSFDYLRFRLEMVDFYALNRGSTQPLLTQGDLKAELFLLPSRRILEHFNRFMSSVFDKLDSGEKESLALAALRDALLPKLVSGELRVG